MTTFTYLSTRDCPRHIESGEGFGSPFADSGLASTGSITDRALRDETEELAGIGAPGPAAPHLHGAFEGEVTRVHSRHVGRLRHEQADQVARQQAHPQLLLDHRRVMRGSASISNVVLMLRSILQLDLVDSGGVFRGEAEMNLRARTCRRVRVCRG
jgi:hypothetical protein